MKRYLLAGAALAALVSPADARDHSAYFGLEVGPMFARDVTIKNTNTGNPIFDLGHKTGVDGDLIAGYDFGFIRAEFEAGHKWARQNDFQLANGTSVDGSGHTSGYSTMANVMADIGKDDTVNFFVGAGAGFAWLHQNSNLHTVVANHPVTLESRAQERGGFAWQGIAGIRVPMFRHFDVGLKYRYFNAGHFEDNGVRGEFKTHSVLASLIYNFNTEPLPLPPPPPAPPPPPPPPPATQTCADGTVILATDVCPAPPPPPPPPAPTPERGN